MNILAQQLSKQGIYQYPADRYNSNIGEKKTKTSIFYINDIPMNFGFLFTYKSLITILESDHTPACDLYPLLRSFQEETLNVASILHKFGFEDAMKYADHLINYMHSYLQQHL